MSLCTFQETINILEKDDEKSPLNEKGFSENCKNTNQLTVLH